MEKPKEVPLCWNQVPVSCGCDQKGLDDSKRQSWTIVLTESPNPPPTKLIIKERKNSDKV